MDRERIRWEHRLRSRLTTIKLALELLRRKPEAAARRIAREGGSEAPIA